MKDFKETAESFAALIHQFKLVEAIDRFYDKDIVAHENEEPPMIGFEKYREETVKFLENLIGNGSAELKNMIISDDITAMEWHYIFHHQKFGKMDYLQLSVQRWKNGKIIHERHYYKTEQLNPENHE